MVLGFCHSQRDPDIGDPISQSSSASTGTSPQLVPHYTPEPSETHSILRPHSKPGWVPFQQPQNAAASPGARGRPGQEQVAMLSLCDLYPGGSQLWRYLDAQCGNQNIGIALDIYFPCFLRAVVRECAELYIYPDPNS